MCNFQDNCAISNIILTVSNFQPRKVFPHKLALPAIPEFVILENTSHIRYRITSKNNPIIIFKNHTKNPFIKVALPRFLVLALKFADILSQM